MIIESRIIGSVGYVGQHISEGFCWSWGNLIAYCHRYVLRPGEDIHWMRGNKSGQYMTRNHLSANLIGDWLLMFDTDHAFDPDILQRMLRLFNGDRKLDVLTALYQYKTPPYQPVLYQYDEAAERYRHIIRHNSDGNTAFRADGRLAFRVDATGGGTLLVRRRVFDQIVQELREKPFDPVPPWGEDFSFFERLRKLGIETFCCPAIQSYHLRTEETHIEEFDDGMTQLLVHTKVPAVQV